MSAWAPKSPYLAQLLDKLGHRQEADTLALRSIALRILQDPMYGYHEAQTRNGWFYVLTKPDLGQFLCDTEVDVWHATTWLEHDAQGRLMGDAPLPPSSGASAPRHVELGELVWRQWTAATQPTTVAGIPVIGVRLAGAASLLDTARHIAKRLPEFQEMAAKQRMSALVAELMSSTTPAWFRAETVSPPPPTAISVPAFARAAA